jgi:hypothetical protein
VYILGRLSTPGGVKIADCLRDEEHSVWQRKPEREQKEETEQSRGGFRGKNGGTS